MIRNSSQHSTIKKNSLTFPPGFRSPTCVHKSKNSQKTYNHQKKYNLFTFLYIRNVPVQFAVHSSVKFCSEFLRRIFHDNRDNHHIEFISKWYDIPKSYINMLNVASPAFVSFHLLLMRENNWSFVYRDCTHPEKISFSTIPVHTIYETLWRSSRYRRYSRLFTSWRIHNCYYLLIILSLMNSRTHYPIRTTSSHRLNN